MVVRNGMPKVEKAIMRVGRERAYRPMRAAKVRVISIRAKISGTVRA